MPLRYCIDKDRRLVLTYTEGPVTFDDVRGHQDRLLADPEFDASFDQLIDTTLTTKFKISADEARILAERRVFSPQTRRAIVASQPHIFGVGRIMEVYHQGVGGEIQVFYSMDEALNRPQRPRQEMTTIGDAMLTFERAPKSQTPKFSSS
jgi:hypothetical protein